MAHSRRPIQAPTGSPPRTRGRRTGRCDRSRIDSAGNPGRPADSGRSPTPDHPAAPADEERCPRHQPILTGCRSVRCSRTTRPGSATSGWTPGSAPPSPGWPTPAHDADGRTAMVIVLSEGAAADAAARDRFAGCRQRHAHRHRAGSRRARSGLRPDGPQVRRRRGRPRGGRRCPARPVGRARVRRDRRGGRRGGPGARRRAAGDPGAAGRPERARLPALLAGAGETRSRPAVAAALARPLRPRRLEDDPGVLVADAAAGRPGRADRDPDLPQPTPADAADPHRWLRQPTTAVAVRISPPPQSGSPSASQSGSESGSPSGSPSGSQSGSPSASGSSSGSASPSPSGTESGGGEPSPDESGSPGGNTPTSRL